MAAQTPEQGPDIQLPGLGKLREAVAHYYRELELPGRTALRQDLLAGLNSAIGSAPSGLASGALAGVNPLYGLYASAIGPMVGGLFSSSQFMVINSTSAAALAASQALGALSGPERDRALFLMVLLVGVFGVLFGLLRLGRLIRFVSYSVMTGFLTGVAVLIILSQLPTVTGYAAQGSNNITKALDVLAHLEAIDLRSLALALLTLLLAVLLPRTRLSNAGPLIAIALPSVLAAILRWGDVQVVRDIGEITGGIPAPFWPSFSDLNLDVFTGALAVALIVVVQGAGVSQSVPNPDGSRSSISRDIVAQGTANIASGIFRGLPVGGSLSATALSLLAHPRTRWSAILAGLWMALFVLVFPGLVSYIVMPALGALLILAGAHTILPAEMLRIWKTGWPSRLAIITTLLATLFLPMQVAVGAGVVLSALLYLSASSTDVSVVKLVKRPDGRIEERQPPSQLPSNQVTVLHVYGHLFYAGARTLERLLPQRGDAQNPVVVLRLRGYSPIGATLIEVLANYAGKLREANGRLYLSGISARAYEQIVCTGKLRLDGPVRAFEATPTLGESTEEAVAEAQAWLIGLSGDSPSGEEASEPTTEGGRS